MKQQLFTASFTTNYLNDSKKCRRSRVKNF